MRRYIRTFPSRKESSSPSENQAAEAAAAAAACTFSAAYGIHSSRQVWLILSPRLFHARGVTSHVIAARREVRASFRKYREKFAEKLRGELTSSSMRRTALNPIDERNLPARITAAIYSSAVKVDK